MSFEAELRLPAKQQYAYINVTIKSDSIEEFKRDLAAVDEQMVFNLFSIHNKACSIVSGNATLGVSRPSDTRTPDELVTQELDAKVVSVEEKPWNREKPAAQEVNFF